MVDFCAPSVELVPHAIYEEEHDTLTIDGASNCLILQGTRLLQVAENDAGRFFECKQDEDACNSHARHLSPSPSSVPTISRKAFTNCAFSESQTGSTASPSAPIDKQFLEALGDNDGKTRTPVAAKETVPLSSVAKVGEKRRRSSSMLQALRRSDVGKVVEMRDSSRKWVRVRIIDVIQSEVYVSPEDGASHQLMQWEDFEVGKFREAAPSEPASQDSSTPQGRSRGQRQAATPEARALALEMGGFSKMLPPMRYDEEDKETQQANKDKNRRAREPHTARLIATRNEIIGKRGEAAGSSSSSNQTRKSSSPSAPVQTRKRDWGLMQVDVVGRNRPPFARTLLCHGAIQAGVRLDGKPVAASNWVVKRWPDNTTRRKVDIEVHEKIRANPSAYLVEIADVHSVDGVLMEHCKEGDLQTLMSTSRRKYTPVPIILQLFLHIIKGLAHLHSLHIVHSDVSPQNVLMRKQSSGALECVLGDFGHSYIMSLHAESRSSVANHGAIFVAPEVELGCTSSMASDVYSAGRILEQMLNSSRNFKDLFEKESKSLVTPLQELSQLMISEDPDKRPSSSSVCASLMCIASHTDSAQQQRDKASDAANQEDEDDD